MSETLKRIDMMAYDDSDDVSKKDIPTEESEDRDWLLDTLTTGPKPFNNIDNGFVANFGGRGGTSTEMDSNDRYALRKIETTKRIKYTNKVSLKEIEELVQKPYKVRSRRKSNKRFAPPKIDEKSLGDTETTEVSSKEEVNNHPTATLMKHNNEELLSLLKQSVQKKRDLKMKRKLKEEKEAPVPVYPKSQEFSSDAFDSLKIGRKDYSENVTPVTNGTNHHNQYVPESYTPLYERPYDNYAQIPSEYKSKATDYEFSSNNYHQGLQKQYSDSREELFVISKHN